MNETLSLEMWQIEVGGQIYEADLEEMTLWIAEGSLLPEDKVRRKNLRWIEAQRVPELVSFFNAKSQGALMPMQNSIVVNTTDGANNVSEREMTPSPNVENAVPVNNPENQYKEFENFAKSLDNLTVSKTFSIPKQEKNDTRHNCLPQIEEFCGLHTDAPTAYYCETCCNAFCKICPKSYGGNVKICPFCGAISKSVGKVKEEFQRNIQNKIHYGESFGFRDFARAFIKPFKHPVSFVIGGAMFMFFSLGQTAGGIGGMFMIFAALLCFMLANMLTFGILGNTVNNFSQGKLDTDFMPRFDDFWIWDDVVHPFFLSIGVYISSFGPLILVCVAAGYLAVSSVSMQQTAIKAEVEKIPGTDYYDTSKTVKQSDEVKKLLESVRGQNANRLNQQEQIMQGGQTAVNVQEDQLIQLQKQAEATQKQQIEAIAGTPPETEIEKQDQFLREIPKLPSVLIIAGFLALLWGIFYFPAACAVAGYTRSFTAAVNPSVGLDTIKRLGSDYVKIMAVFILIVVCTTVINAVLNTIFAPLELPKLGNIPANLVGSFFTFYFSIVFSCVLGYAFFKNSDKLNFYKG